MSRFSGEEWMSGRWVVRLSTSRAFAWWIRHVATHLDPLLFRATNGRWTSMGPAVVPMVTITTTGRRSGLPRSVHLACVDHEGHPHVVASAMGQEKHPAWRYNLEANPVVDVQARGERFTAKAQVLTDPEKAEVWPKILKTIPQIGIYTTRTDRVIRVFRLKRILGTDQRTSTFFAGGRSR